MAREFFKNLPDTSTPLNAPRLNNFLNGNEAMGSIVVDDISSKNLLDIRSYGIFNNFAFPNVFEYLDDGWMHYVNNTGTYEGLQFLSFKVKPNTKYVIKIEFADRTGSPIVMFRQRTGDTTVVSTEYLYSSAVKTTGSNTDNVVIALTTDSLNSQANSKVRIMVCEGDDTSVEYTPYINFKNEEIYSLGETKIGTWIDGKPLYRKVIKYTNTETIGEVGKTIESPIPHKVSNLGQVTRCDLFSTTNQKFPRASGSTTINSWSGIAGINATDVVLRIINETWSTRPWIIIMEYTKTTD